MVTSPYLQLLKESVVANQGLPKIKGYLPRFDFSCRTMKSTRYSKEYIEINEYSKIPLG